MNQHSLRTIFKKAARGTGAGLCLSAAGGLAWVGYSALSLGTLEAHEGRSAEIESIASYAAFIGAFGMTKLGLLIWRGRNSSSVSSDSRPSPAPRT